MAIYQYQAISRTGKKVKGVVDADSPVAARRKLREQSLVPTRMVESFGKEALDDEEGAISLKRVGLREVALATRQLAVLLQAGMPLVEALGALMDQTSNVRLRRSIFDIRDRVNEGTTLAEAMRQHPRIFGDLFVNMVHAGESSGALEQVLLRLADIIEKQVRLQHKVMSLLAYPIIMGLVSVGIVTFLMMKIVPKITQIFERQGQDLPTITQITVQTSHFLGQRWWVILLAMAGLYAAWRAWVARPEGRRAWDRIKLKMPLFGALHMKMVCVRLARTLGTTLESGLTMMRALDVVKTVVQNRVVEEALEDVKTGVRRGRDLSIPLKEAAMFPPLLVHMVDLGQRSGEIEKMLLKVADTYDEDIELTVGAIVSLVEPLMIVFMGLFVGVLVISILLPIFSMSAGI